jgi:hypothetical protein
MKIGMGTPVAQNARRTSLKQFSPASRSVAWPIFGNITAALIDARIPQQAIIAWEALPLAVVATTLDS